MSLPRHASRGPTWFLAHHVRRRLGGHLFLLGCVMGAVGCSIGSQYAIKNLVDVMAASGRVPGTLALWSAVALLLGLVAGDHSLWRVAGWVASYVFVAVGGDLRVELFDHLSRHGAQYFSERFPGALAGRIT